MSAIDNVVEAVRADLLARSQVGIQKYGVTLDRTDLNLRDWLQHAYEETLDQANYLKRAMIEWDELASHANTSSDQLGYYAVGELQFLTRSADFEGKPIFDNRHRLLFLSDRVLGRDTKLYTTNIAEAYGYEKLSSIVNSWIGYGSMPDNAIRFKLGTGQRFSLEKIFEMSNGNRGES